jgi:hypothetical protein
MTPLFPSGFFPGYFAREKPSYFDSMRHHQEKSPDVVPKTSPERAKKACYFVEYCFLHGRRSERNHE